MDILATICRDKEANTWFDGNSYIHCNEVLGMKYFVMEKPCLEPSVMGFSASSEIQQIISHPLCFERIAVQSIDEFYFSNKKNKETEDDIFNNLIYTAEKYFVDGRKFKDNFDLYVSELKNSAHRKSIRRFRNDFKKAGAYIKYLDAETASLSHIYNELLRLHLEVQRRNNSSKNEKFFDLHVQALREHPHRVFCIVAENNKKEIVAFAFCFLEKDVCSEFIDDTKNHDRLYMALVGNNYEKGSVIMAYHNVMAECVNLANSRNCVLDLGLSHFSVKKVFEPQILHVFLRYNGNSLFLFQSIRIFSELQRNRLIKSPTQKI
jgi:hypothetical protein